MRGPAGGPELATNVIKTLTLGLERPFCFPRPVAWPLYGNRLAPWFRPLLAGETRPDGRTSHQSELQHEGVRLPRSRIVVTETPPVDTTDSGEARIRLNTTHDQQHAHPGQEIRGLPHPDSRRRHCPGAGWRRDQLQRAARHFQQHQPGRRRLQQRLLRRADGRAARAIDITLDAVQEFQVVASGASANSAAPPAAWST